MRKLKGRIIGLQEGLGQRYAHGPLKIGWWCENACASCESSPMDREDFPEADGQEGQDCKCQLSSFPSLMSITQWVWEQSGHGDREGRYSWVQSHELPLTRQTWPPPPLNAYQEQRPTLSPADSSKCVWCGWHGQPPSYWLYWTPFTVDLVAIFLTRMGICSGYRFDFPAMLLLAMSSVDSLKA